MTVRLLPLFIALCVLLMPASAADDGSTIDLLLAYTPGGKAQLGGTESLVISKFSAALNTVNTRLADAAIATEFRVIGARQTFYQEQVNVDFHADLTNLIGTTDGYMDELHALRDVYAADLVILVAGNQFAIYRGDAPTWAGADATQGFAIVEGRYFTADTLIAQLGYLLGATGENPTLEAATLNANRVAVANYRESLGASPQELLFNGDFEIDTDSDNIPDFWTLVKPAKSEGRRCNAFARMTGCALKINGVAGSKTRFRYTVGSLDALPGDALTLTAYARTQNAQTGATIRVIARYHDAPEQKRILRAPIGTADYTQLSGTLALSGAPKNVLVVIGFHGAGAKGKTWFDDVSLSFNRLPRS